MPKRCTVEELRFVSGSSNKFYRGYLISDGPNSMAVYQWGRRGTAGQIKVVPCSSPDAAIRAVERQLRSKRYEGYTHEWGPETIDVFPLPPKQSLGPHLSGAWLQRQRHLAGPALRSLSSVDPAACNAVLVLHRFDLEARSELVAGVVESTLPELVHARGKHGCAVWLPEAVAAAVASKYSSTSEILSSDVPVDAAFLEVMVGVWDPASSGPLSTAEGALEMASAIV